LLPTKFRLCPYEISSHAPGQQGSIWEYSFFVPHDQSALIEKFGGAEQFVKRLEFLHDQRITLISNEPSFLTVFQYHYAGRAGLSAKRAHYYIPTAFKPTPDGLPGNGDSRAMGSFLAFTMIGLFSNPGQDVYLIIPPFFKAVSIRSPITNKTATISAANSDPQYEDIYVQSVLLNGSRTAETGLISLFSGREGSSADDR
jgi:putative alpha-1,2-mannosidase